MTVNHRDLAQSTFDNFLLRTYPLFGATLVALAAWGPGVGTNCLAATYWIIWLAFLVIFVRFAMAAVATYKYLFAISNADVSTSDKFQKKEKFWYKMRNVRIAWYIAGLVLFLAAVILRVVAAAI